jgi:regulator of sigma E protease
VDESLSKKIFKQDVRNSFSKNLKRGDKIIAIDGIKVKSSYDILKVLQKNHLLIITQRFLSDKSVSVNNADKAFDEIFNLDSLNDLIASIGAPEGPKSSDLVLLNPVTPLTLEEMALISDENSIFYQQFEDVKKSIKEYKAEEASNFLKQKRLGVLFLDRKVLYNPNPFSEFSFSFLNIKKTFSSLVTGKLNPKHMAGPVGIMQVMHHGFSLGFLEALFWLGLISLNLGVINLLPIPVLDGGYIVLSLIEMITKKPMKTKTMEKIMFPFVILLIGGIIFFTYNDIVRLIKMFF